MGSVSEEIITKLYEINNINDIYELSDYLFESIDDLLCENNFEVVDEIIENINLSKFDSYFLVGLLSITFAARKKLKNRETMVERIERLLRLMNPNTASELMKGLR